ncbi:MAG: hypothetical protein WAV56_00690 [Microgenomates group bacterium]
MAEKRKKNPEIVSREVTPFELDRLGRMVNMCLEEDISFILSFETGRYVSGEHTFSPDGKLLKPDEIPAEHIVQGPQGLKVEVGGTVHQDKEGKELLYSSFLDAINTGLQVLYWRIAEKRGEPAAKEVFERYFKVVD